MFKMQTLNCHSLKISTPNHVLSTEGNFGTHEKSSHFHSHYHVYSSHSHFWNICVPIPMGRGNC